MSNKVADPRRGKGRAPGRKNPRRARFVGQPKKFDPTDPTDEGMKPLKRDRERAGARRAGPRGAFNDPGADALVDSPVSRWSMPVCLWADRMFDDRLGRRVRDRLEINRKRGSRVERLRRSSSCQALKGEPRERARLKCRGDRQGSKASKHVGSAGTQRDLEEAIPGVVAPAVLVALWGKKPRESVAPGARGSRMKL